MGKGIRNWHENKYKRSFIKTKGTNRSCNVMQGSEINLYFHVLILLTFTCLCYMYYFISNIHKLIKVQYVTFCLRRGFNFQKQYTLLIDVNNLDRYPVYRIFFRENKQTSKLFKGCVCCCLVCKYNKCFVVLRNISYGHRFQETLYIHD